MKHQAFRHTTAVLLLFLYFCSSLNAQNSLEEIFLSTNNYHDIVQQGEQYFKTKYPNLRFSQLSEGVHRDGEFVKFMRWRSFWKNSLNSDGTLGDVSAYWRKQQKQPNISNRNIDLYGNIEWTNLSYEDYIISQIGLGRTTSMGFHPNDPDIFYVGAAIGGIWKTMDGGQTYVPLGDDLPFMAISSIIVNQNNPNIIYIAISDHVWYGPPSIGVYKSIDGGASWEPTALSFDLTENIRIYWMEVDPNDPDKIFVAAADGLYRTDDGFETVEQVNSISSFDVKVNLGNTNIVYQGGRNGEFYRSTDGGISFNLVQDFGNDNVYAAITPLNTSKVYVRHGTSMHKSTNDGTSFSSSVTLPENNSVLIFSPSNEQVLITGNFETQRSDNDGTSFYQTMDWLGGSGLPDIHVDQRNIFYNPLESDYVYYTNDGGVYRYVISSNQFENLCNGLLITQFYDIAVSQTDENIIGGGSQDNGNVYRNAAGIWEEYAGTGDGMNQEIDPTDENTRYWAYQNGGLRRWTNGSNSNIAPPNQNGEGAWETPYRLDPNNPSRIIAGYDRVYESLNKGDNWTDISGTIFGGTLHELAIAPSNSNRIYVTRNSQLYVKDVGSNTWTSKPLPASISDIEVDENDMNLIYISVPGFSTGSKVYQSFDAGDNWENISGSLPNVSTGAIELYNDMPGGIFAGTDAGVYYKDDMFEDWQLYGNLPHTRVEDIEIQYTGQLIRVGTHGRGVLEAPIVVDSCPPDAPDSDNDNVCDARDLCPNFDNNLIGTSCEDGDPFTDGEIYTTQCECAGGASNIVHCAAEGANGTGSDWISRVALNTLNHGSGQTNYSDFRAHSTTLEIGESYTLTVNLNHSFSLDEVYAWIDYNRDGTFNPSEAITMSPIDGSHKSTGTVTVPQGTTPQATTMRVRVIYADPNPADPCGSYFGEVEDYTLFFDEPCSDIDNDGVCDTEDICPNFDDNLIGTSCEDGDPFTDGEIYSAQCECEGGASNIVHCFAEGANGTGADWISGVALNTLNHSSGKTNYSDFRIHSTTLEIGESYTLTVNLNHSFSLDEVYGWIDYNRDGTFDSSEAIAMSPIDGNHTSTGTVIVPQNTTPQATTLRVRVIYADPNPADPCGSYFGEVEDYTLFFSGLCDDIDNDGVCDEEDLCIGPSDTPLVLDTDPAGSGQYSAVSTIESNVTIHSPYDIEYVAGESIELQENFEVKTGATFYAYIEDCTTQMLQTIEEDIQELAENRDVLPKDKTAPELFVFPNPFTGSTTINYTLSEAAPLEIFITDLSGKKVVQLLETSRQEAGTYQLEWKSPEQYSGMLLLFFKANDKVLVKKLVVN